MPSHELSIDRGDKTRQYHAVYIIVLNWNNSPDTVQCLNSLQGLGCTYHHTVVVDNGSTDDSVAQIRRAFPNIKILETDANLGYAGGNNFGIRQALAAGAEAICILNNDVTVEPGFLVALLDALQEKPEAGVVTPLVAEKAEVGDQVWALGSSVNWRTASVTRNHAGELVERWRGHPPLEVDIASGTAMLVRREVFESAGLMDEGFFLYYEEVDWSLAVRQAGYRILAVPSSVVWHKVSATLGMMSPVIDYYMLRNHLRLVSRNWRGSRRIYLQVRIVMRNLLTIVAYTLKSHRGLRTPHRNARLRALWDASTGHWGQMSS